MGGPGSGRLPGWMDSRTHCKETTEDYFALDIRAVKRHGLITEGQEGLPGIARIEWRSSGFGGVAGEGHYLRPWFICPQEECHRRVAILYQEIDPETGNPLWACRTCRNLCYPVELEDRAERRLRRMDKIRFKLGPGGTRPKGMHHKTFVRLARQYIREAGEYGEAARERLAHNWEQMEKERIRWEIYRR